MSFNGADFCAALIHELKNELNLLALAIEGIPRHDVKHDQAVDAAQLLCQRFTSLLQQAGLIYRTASQPIHPQSTPGRPPTWWAKSPTVHGAWHMAACTSMPRWRRIFPRWVSSTVIWCRRR